MFSDSSQKRTDSDQRSIVKVKEARVAGAWNQPTLKSTLGPYDSKYPEINNHVEDKHVFGIILVFNEYLWFNIHRLLTDWYLLTHSLNPPAPEFSMLLTFEG